MVLHREEMEVKHTLWAIRTRHFAYLRSGLLTRSFRETLVVHRNEKVRAAAAEWRTELKRYREVVSVLGGTVLWFGLERFDWRFWPERAGGAW